MICNFCKKNLKSADLLPSYSPFWEEGNVPFCFNCVAKKMDIADLNVGNRICQMANCAFFPNDWNKFVRKTPTAEGLRKYFNLYGDINYQVMDWGEQNALLEKKARHGLIEDEIEELEEHLTISLKKFWGNQPPERLRALEEQYNITCEQYGVSSNIEADLIKKFTFISIMIDEELKAGMTNKDSMSAYKEILIQINKVMENSSHTKALTSLGEVFAVMEKMGYKPNFYDGIPKTEIDFLANDIRGYLKKLIEGESLITEQYYNMKENLSRIQQEIGENENYDEDEDEEEF